MGNVSLRQYILLCLHKAKKEAWEHCRAHIPVEGGIVITTSAITIAVKLIEHEAWKTATISGIGIGFGALVLYLLTVWVIKMIVAPHHIHREQNDRITTLENKVRQLESRINGLTAKPTDDMSVAQVIGYFVNTLKYEAILDIECELLNAAVNGWITVWGMGRDNPASAPVPPDIFKDHVFVFRKNALESIAKLDTFGLTPDLIKTGGVIIHGRRQTIAYVNIWFSETQIKSTQWPDKRSQAPQSTKPPTSEK